MTITEFLNARYDEEERIAREADEYSLRVNGPDRPDAGMYLNMDEPALVVDERRVLREIAAKRLIVEEHPHETYREHLGESRVQAQGAEWLARHKDTLDLPYCQNCHVDDGVISRHVDGTPCLPLRMLAAVYADHPDYQQEWTP